MEAHQTEELWRSLLTGENPKLRQGRRLFAWFPTPDTQTARCKMCLSPFEGFTAPIVRTIFGRRRWERCPYYCDVCENVLLTNPGGTELDTALLFADMRGSTNLAAKIGPSEFSRLMQRFYSTATRVLTKHNGYIDKLIGDEVMALFIPAMSGANLARDAVLAAPARSFRRRATMTANLGYRSASAFIAARRSSAASDQPPAFTR